MAAITSTVKKHISKDPLIRPLVEQYSLRDRPDFNGDVYFGLIRSIVYQQLSGKAAAAIFSRFLDLFPERYPGPDRLLTITDEKLRAIGLSRSKVLYIKSAADFWMEHQLNSQDWSSLSDLEIMDLLTQIHGVGKWTAQMVLIFILHRPDVLPIDDLIVRRNLVALYGLHNLKGKELVKALFQVTSHLSPYRSFVSRYLWEAKNDIQPQIPIV